MKIENTNSSSENSNKQSLKTDIHTIKFERAWQLFSKSLVNNPKLSSFYEPLIQPFLPGWSTEGYRSEVVGIRKEIESVITVILKPSSSWKGFRAGQYVNLSVDINGSKMLRTFSISSDPSSFYKDGIIELTIKVKKNGKVTRWLKDSLKLGDYVRISHAGGDFVLPETFSPLLFIAGGSGITPFRSFIKELIAQKKTVDITLLYYCTNDEYIFSWDLKRYELLIPGFNIHFINTSDEGRFSLEQLNKLCPSFKYRKSYICAPTQMIEHVETLLLKNQVPSSSIFFEYFGPPSSLATDKHVGTVTFLNENNVLLTQKSTNETLLDLAENAGLNPVTGCRIGICHQCICKKERGTVFNTLTKEYSDTGAEEVQLCISVAVGDVELNL